MSDLREYVQSYVEHSNKIVKASGDPSQVYNVRGWIGDCRHFAQKAYDEAMHTLNTGGQVYIDNKDGSRTYWNQDDVGRAYGRRMEWILRAERENEELARKHGY